MLNGFAWTLGAICAVGFVWASVVAIARQGREFTSKALAVAFALLALVVVCIGVRQ